MLAWSLAHLFFFWKISCFFLCFFCLILLGWNVLELERLLHSWRHLGQRNTKICIHGASRMKWKCGKCWKLAIFEGKLQVFISYLSEMKTVNNCSITLPCSSTCCSLFISFFALEIFKFKYDRFFARHSASISKFKFSNLNSHEVM